jgi:hypothetical protein
MTADPALTPAEAQQAYVDRFAQLTPRNPPTREPGERPRAMLLGGQPAAWKSTTQRLVYLALGGDQVASYDSDDNAAVHPRFDAIMREQGTEAFHVIYEALPEDLHDKSLDHLRAGDPKYDVVASHPLTREEWAKEWVQGFNQNDYRVSVAYIATNDANSMLGLVDRYQGARDNEGGGRWLDPDLHDTFYREMPATAQALESEGLVDDIYVVNRDGYVIYENHRDADGNWEHEPGVGQAIQDERDRPPTPEAREYFDRTADRLLNGRDPSLPPLEDKVRQTVEEAVRREHARPASQPDTRGRGASDRIDRRLDLSSNQAGRTQQAAQGTPAGQAVGPPPGVDADAWKAQRLSSAGIAAAGSGPGPAPGSSTPVASTSHGQSERRTPGHRHER